MIQSQIGISKGREFEPHRGHICYMLYILQIYFSWSAFVWMSVLFPIFWFVVLMGIAICTWVFR
ncbi:hypothetical protein F5Y17DRAFT_432424 [Xylariaceae sp. FL0594]|nr:hypothetical protein F5Y17DRAFT_432424 [Xylariaceae sp. FL0594]